jgi:hypothetical protein
MRSLLECQGERVEKRSIKPKCGSSRLTRAWAAPAPTCENPVSWERSFAASESSPFSEWRVIRPASWNGRYQIGQIPVALVRTLASNRRDSYSGFGTNP